MLGKAMSSAKERQKKEDKTAEKRKRESCHENTSSAAREKGKERAQRLRKERERPT